jgi:Protein of unknown function (DUF3313)
MSERKGLKVLIGLVAALGLGMLMTGCASTAAPAPNIIQRVQGETPAAPPQSGFLGSNYSLLQPAASEPGQKAMLAYINRNANFAQYHAIIIEPVTYWADSNSTLPANEQQTLCNYFYSKLQNVFYENFSVVTDPGPGVLRLSVALTDASSATPALRTISVVVPQAHALSLIKYGLTGTYAFVGSATGEAKLTDSMSGELLAAWEDQRFGSGAVKNAVVWQWGDAEHAMDYWAKGLDQRLVTLGVQNTGPLASE